jgi:MarR family 2-MHQ and catechol resistance regulon transcriptional repressor
MKKRGSPGARGEAETETAGIHLWLVLWKATRSLEAHARRSVEALGMCRSDFGVLEALLHKGPQPVNALGKRVLLTSGSITTAVDRLERRGWVERRGDADDRRARIVHLTNAGHTVIRKLFAEHERDMERAVAGLPPVERGTLVEMLRKLGRRAEDLLDESQAPAVGDKTRRWRKEGK